uniref:Molybdenum ABC transporter ATP-binding protein n=1 Tax=Prevotella sp. GTC17254 TaxID=3236794 RepID=A0AB33J1Y1_9BACT
MDKQKVYTTSSMKKKGYSSSSHYRIKSVVGQSEQVLATKFVQWNVEPLESLSSSKVYLLRAKLNRGEVMSREEKDWLCEAVNSNTYFRTAVPLMGYRFDFLDVLKKYLVAQYGQWAEYYAPDRTSLRAYLYGRVNQIVEIPKQ